MPLAKRHEQLKGLLSCLSIAACLTGAPAPVRGAPAPVRGAPAPVRGALASPAVARQTPQRAGVTEDDLQTRLAALMDAAGGSSGAWVVNADTGEQLFAASAGVRRTPASVQKLFTTSALLDRLGEDFRIETGALARGDLVDGTLSGDLYVKGAGDPSFDSARLGELAAAIREAGVEHVSGRIYGDESYFDRRRGVPASGFAVSRYVGPLSALAFNHGTLAPVAQGFQTEPARFVAGRLHNALESRGVAVDRAPREGRAKRESWQVASLPSPSLASLVRHTNQVSDNYYAETLLKGLGVRAGGGGSTAAGAAVVKRVEAEQGVASQVVDGSGLSRTNAASPRAVGRLLAAATEKQWFGSFYRSLPLAGRSGTLAKRMRGTAAEGRCRAKTGTLSGVSGLAGYCKAREGARIAFALLMNRVSVFSARRVQDRIAAALASYRG